MLVYGAGQRIIYFLFSLLQFLYHQRVNAQEVIQSNRKTANACVTSTDCPTNAFCEHFASEYGQCICQKGYFIVEENKIKKCHKVASNIGQPCSYQESCQISFGADAECVNGTCQCKKDSHFVPKDGGFCYKSSLIGEYCKVSANCIGDETVCRSGKCECPFSSHTNANHTYCHKTVQLGEICNVNEECIAEYSMCHDKCICRAGYILNSNKTRCLKIASKLYDRCEEDDQCLSTIGCSKCGHRVQISSNNSISTFDAYSKNEQICVCAKGYHDVNYKCYSSTALGYKCDGHENCVTPFSECRSGICFCQEGYRRFRMQCSSSSQIKKLGQLLLTIVFTLGVIFI